MNASQIACKNLERTAQPVLTKYRSYLLNLRPGQSRNIYPWDTPEDVVMEVANRLSEEGWIVNRKPYKGSKANYSGGDYFISITAPPATKCRLARFVGSLNTCFRANSS